MHRVSYSWGSILTFIQGSYGEEYHQRLINTEKTKGMRLTSAKVETQVRLGANNLAPLQELVGANLVGFGSDPSKFRSHNASAPRPPNQQLRTRLTSLVAFPGDLRRRASGTSQ